VAKAPAKTATVRNALGLPGLDACCCLAGLR
jgi:hypothetical protein